MAGPDWLFERPIARGTVRLGIQGTRFQAELNGRMLKLANNDILKLEDLAASRHTAHLVKPLRDGGYLTERGALTIALADTATLPTSV